MKKILLAAINILPILTYGQSMKIASKQIKSGLNGQVIVTRNGVNVLDSLKWADISNKPATPTLQQVTTAGATTNNPVTVDIGNVATSNSILSLNQNGGSIVFANGTGGSTSNFLPTIKGVLSGTNLNASLTFTGQGADSYTKGFVFSQSNTTGTGQVTGGNLFTISNYTTDKLSLDYNGVLTLPNLAGGGTTMVVANNSGTLSTQPLITNNNQLTNGAGYLTTETDPVWIATKNATNLGATGDVPLKTYSAITDWYKPIGYSNLISTTSTGLPTNAAYPYYFVLGHRNQNGGDASLLINYDGTHIYYGTRSNNTVYPSWNEIAKISDIPTNNTQLTNGAGYITSSSIPTVNNATLTLATGSGLTGSQTFTANSATNKTFTVELSPATATTIGGIKVGSRLSIASGVLSADNMIQNLGISGQTLSISGGNSVTLPTPSTPDLQQVTDVGATASNNIELRTGDNSASYYLNLGSYTPNSTVPSIIAKSHSGGNGLLIRAAANSNTPTRGAFVFEGYQPDMSTAITGGNLFRISNGDNATGSVLDIAYNGQITSANLAGSGNRMVIANSSGTLSTQALITNNNQLTNGAGYITSGSLPTNYVTTNSTQTGLTGNKTWGGNQTFNGSVTLGGITGTGPNFLYVDAAGLIHATTLPGSSTSIIVGGGTIQRAALTGDVTAAQNSNATTIANNVVTFAKMQTVPTASLLGRYGSGTGNVQSITLGGGLSLNGSGVLSVTTVNEIDATGNFNYGFPTESYDGFDTKGGVAHNIKEVAANTNYTVQSNDYSILFNAASTGNVTCYLPEPSQTPIGRILIISNFNTTYSVTLNNIEGNNQGSSTMLKGAVVYIQNNGTKWRCLFSANVGGF